MKKSGSVITPAGYSNTSVLIVTFSDKTQKFNVLIFLKWSDIFKI